MWLSSIWQLLSFSCIHGFDFVARSPPITYFPNIQINGRHLMALKFAGTESLSQIYSVWEKKTKICEWAQPLRELGYIKTKHGQSESNNFWNHEFINHKKLHQCKRFSFVFSWWKMFYALECRIILLFSNLHDKTYAS